MHTFPVDELRISEIEQGRSCEAVVPLPVGDPLLAGQAVLFAHAVSRRGQPPCYVKGGDSVLVSLTGVTDFGATDPRTGQALVRLIWAPVGQDLAPAGPESKGKPRRSRRSI